jgi:D-alanyl-D-alanine carboxypeptidase/D-alanyl-D-alanine-endopeptidase (penicillin-binding protein 4)
MSVGVTRCLLAGLGLFCLAGGTAWAQPLNDDIERILAKNKFSADRVGISIVALGEGGTPDSVLANFNATRPMIPASNQKVLTSGVALMVMGADYKFKTEFQLLGDKLIVKAGGDPSFGDPVLLERSKSKLTVPDLLSSIAAAIKKGGSGTGVGEISEIIIDDRIFDRVVHHPTWPVRHLDEAYCPEVSGLSFHANVLAIFPSPGKVKGQPARVKIEPEVTFVEIDNTATTAGAKEPNTVRAERVVATSGTIAPAAYRFKVRGDVSQPLVEPMELPLTENPKFFGMVLAEELARAGVRVGSGNKAGVLAVRLVESSEAFDGARTLVTVETPMADVLMRCNTNSMNLYAECLVKMVGHKVTNEPGSWRNGPEVVRMYLAQRLGPEFASSTTIVDGSGLSDNNKVAPATLTRWLDVVASDPKMSAAFLSSLATPDSASSRMRRLAKAGLKNEVRCKTGHINGVLSLSGYVESRSDKGSAAGAAPARVAFSLIYNEAKGYRGAEAVDMQEEIVKAIDTWMNKRK